VFFSAATEPGTRDSPNEDWVGISPTTAIVLDGVTVFKEVETGCMHGTPWYVNQLGTRLLAAALDQKASLRSALRTAISNVANSHAGVCDLDQIGAPSAAVAVIRKNERFIEYLVLADVAILVESVYGLTVISDERVSGTVDDLAGKNNSSTEVMKRRERYRNKEGGYWVAAADPEVVEHAKVGQVPLDGFRCAAMMSDGVTRLVAPFEQMDWPGILALARKIGPTALIERVRKIEEGDMKMTRWPRFKVSDDATIALINA
jgi:Protein phosphatase 2C